jgi:hypothetical protein
LESRGRWLTLPVAVLVALAIAAPVAAGSLVGRPDAQVRRAGGTQLGDNIYNLDGTGQTVGGQKARRYEIGAVRWFYVYAYNDGTASDANTIAETKTFTLEVAAASLTLDPYLVQYYSPSGADITTAVQAGTFMTPTLAPGGRYGIKVKITVTSAAGHGSGVQLLLTVSSFSQPLTKDAVGIKMRRR